MSTFEDRSGRADARRNTRRILDSAAELLATDPLVSLDRVAAHAQVSRTTLYHHFPGRDALLDSLTARSIGEITSALQTARPAEGPALEAMQRSLVTAWQVVARYRGLLAINPRRLGSEELRRRLGPAVAPLVTFIIRGQRDGEFDPTLPSDWLLGLLVDMIYAASAQVSAGTMDPATAEGALLRSATAVLVGPR